MSNERPDHPICFMPNSEFMHELSCLTYTNCQSHTINHVSRTITVRDGNCICENWWRTYDKKYNVLRFIMTVNSKHSHHWRSKVLQYLESQKDHPHYDADMQTIYYALSNNRYSDRLGSDTRRLISNNAVLNGLMDYIDYEQLHNVIDNATTKMCRARDNRDSDTTKRNIRALYGKWEHTTSQDKLFVDVSIEKLKSVLTKEQQHNMWMYDDNHFDMINNIENNAEPDEVMYIRFQNDEYHFITGWKYFSAIVKLCQICQFDRLSFWIDREQRSRFKTLS